MFWEISNQIWTRAHRVPGQSEVHFSSVGWTETQCHRVVPLNLGCMNMRVSGNLESLPTLTIVVHLE